MPEHDTEFLRRLRAGHAHTFAAVVKVYAPRIRRLAMSFFRSPFEQEEAVQEVFVHLYRQRTLVDPMRGDKLDGFVATLARRKMIDILRALKPDAVLPSERADDVFSEAPGPDEQAQTRELEELLGRFEELLKPAFRSYFRAVYVEGKSDDEARIGLGLGRLRAKYVKKVLLLRLRRHGPLLDYLGRSRRPL